MAERWTREQYEAYLDSKLEGWRALRVVMPCTCEYEACHGWVASRLEHQTEHEEEETDRAEMRRALPQGDKRGAG